ncbi:PspC domain-containing protein [Isoptericola dokdonensis]|jgi:phage shock protein C|uniref:DNA-binding transcriptional activator PspC n=1 Tax=Isoptericola dokdonensis DS-3 TaxID=1300344 RepID=A0A161IES9_9MICO|nr:PspC domain-containing protein [Isoptericola dokdonensis]ANC31887.1 DNA-binding transcriptional activator PspC [Isoptericola dokdonensis DS-3]
MSSNPQQPRKFYRPTQGRVLGGVCAGIADYFGWSRTTVRVLAALSVLIPGPQVLAYIVCWILVPDQRKAFA